MAQPPVQLIELVIAATGGTAQRQHHEGAAYCQDYE
jgi:hypothetical protein